jgi:hypothetical protein
MKNPIEENDFAIWSAFRDRGQRYADATDAEEVLRQLQFSNRAHHGGLKFKREKSGKLRVYDMRR